MPIEHLPADADPQQVADAIARDGAVIVDRLAPGELLNRVAAELAPSLGATPTGPDDFSGRNTRRTGALIARSPAARELVVDPLVLSTTGLVLGHATNFQLHLTQAIAIGPGQEARPSTVTSGRSTSFPFPPSTRCSATRSGR